MRLDRFDACAGQPEDQAYLERAVVTFCINRSGMRYDTCMHCAGENQAYRCSLPRRHVSKGPNLGLLHTLAQVNI